MMNGELENLFNGKEERGVAKFRFSIKGTEYKWYSCFMTPIRAEDGTVSSIVGIHQDVTDEMNLQLERKKAQENLQFIIDRLPIPIVSRT